MRAVLPRTLGKLPRETPAPPTAPEFRLRKCCLDHCKLHSSRFTVPYCTKSSTSISPRSPCARCVTAARRLQHLSQIFLRLEQRVFRLRFGNFQRLSDLRGLESRYFVNNNV